jgi:uncharacterized SAM-binding protein YcdF (DUF218 family)
VRVFHAVAIAGATAAALIVVGFVRFIIPPIAENNPARTDAIVVLTGGDLRLQSGIELMRAGKGRALFVSGVNRRVDLDQLLRSAGEKSPDWLICCIVLGHDARNTTGNAEETGEWMRRLGYHSLRLVTAWYHIPRSLLEFRRAIPDVEIIPHPVFSEEANAQNSWGWRGTVPLLISEYGKYLAAMLLPVVDRPSLAGVRYLSAEAQR